MPGGGRERANTSSRPARRFFLLLDIGVPEAFRGVIIYHSYRLHERVADSGPNKPEASLAQLFAHSIGLSAGRRNLAERAKFVFDRSTTNEPPHVLVEGPELFPRDQKLFGVCDSRFDFETVTYDAWVAK